MNNLSNDPPTGSLVIGYEYLYIDTLYSFENLNFRPHNIPRIMAIIEADFPQYLAIYEELKKDRSYWDLIESNIRKYCEEENLSFSIEFHHGGFSKS